MPHTDLTLTAPDGTPLHLERREATGPARGTLILLHGFAVHSGQYRHVAQALAEAGLNVIAVDSRGHGQSGGRRGYVRRFQDFQDDLHVVVEAARAWAPTVPLALGGHSHGALIGLDYVLAGRAPIAALALVCPYLALRLKVPLWKRVLGDVMGVLWPTLPVGNELRPEDTTRFPETRAQFDDDPLAHHVATPRWFNEVRAAQARILAQAPTLRVPTFMALAGDDRIVKTDIALAFAHAAGPVVQTKVYPEAFHEVFFEPDWRLIVDQLSSWLVAHLTAPYN